MTTLPEKLMQLRICRGLTQKALAQFLHCSTGTVSNYENGIHSPDYDTLLQLATFYGISTDYLLGNATSDMPDGILSQALYGGYNLGRFLRLWEYLDSNDKSALVHQFHILEQLRIPK